MSFTTPFFLFVFGPVTALLYRIDGGEKYRKLLLCAASLLFYAFAQADYLLLLLGSVLANYLFGIGLHKKKSRTLLVLAVGLNVVLLCLFKYSVELGLSSLTLPLGISVFTFSGISYVVDTYRDPDSAESDFSNLLLQMALFPKILAGPNEKSRDLTPQLAELKRPDAAGTCEGIVVFIRGFSKKMLLAEPMAFAADKVLACYSQNGIGDFRLSWIFAVAYMLQIYFDFSGYSDMAVGLGKLFGLEFTENFRHPYGSSSLKEFWRKWHRSLSGWFMEYVYIPLGGNRNGTGRTVLNRMIVFFLTGIWHGANLTYVFWGFGHGLLTNLEDLGVIPVKKLKERTWGKLLLKVYTLLSVMLLFVIFRSETLTQGFGIISAMFSSPASAVNNNLIGRLLTPAFLFAALFGILLSGSIPERWAIRNRKAEVLLTLLLFILSILAMAKGTTTPFIYAQF